MSSGETLGMSPIDPTSKTGYIKGLLKLGVSAFYLPMRGGGALTQLDILDIGCVVVCSSMYLTEPTLSARNSNSVQLAFRPSRHREVSRGLRDGPTSVRGLHQSDEVISS